MLSLDQPTNPLSAQIHCRASIYCFRSLLRAQIRHTRWLVALWSTISAQILSREPSESTDPFVPPLCPQTHCRLSLVGTAAQRSQAGCATEKESVSAARQTKRNAASGEEQLCASQYICVDILHTQIYAPCMYHRRLQLTNIICVLPSYDGFFGVACHLSKLRACH